MKVATFLLTTLSTIAAAQYPIRTIYEFPSPPAGQYINVENIAVRKNGSLLLTTVTGPTIYQLNPASPSPKLLAAIPAALTSITGITETHPGSDVFIVPAGNFTFGLPAPPNVAGIPGSWSIWSVDAKSGYAVPKQVASIKEASFLNGVTTIPGYKDAVLIADSVLGVVWFVNIKTGAYYKAVSDPLFAPSPYFALGINGIHVKNNVLFFTNSAQRIFGKVHLGISSKGVVGALGAAETVVSAPPPSDLYAFDDFAFDYNGNVWAATPFNAVSVIKRSGEVSIVAGGGNDTTLSLPTSVAFGNNCCTLYVTTGGQGGPLGQERSGGVFALDVCKKGKPYKA